MDLEGKSCEELQKTLGDATAAVLVAKRDMNKLDKKRQELEHLFDSIENAVPESKHFYQ